MSKITKKELNNLIVRYAVVNEEKKPLVNECKSLSEEIKDAMEDRGVTTFQAMGFVATVIYKKSKKLNLDRLSKLLTKEQIESCKDEVVIPTLNVTATAKTAEPTPKVEKVTAAA